MIKKDLERVGIPYRREEGAVKLALGKSSLRFGHAHAGTDDRRVSTAGSARA